MAATPTTADTTTSPAAGAYVLREVSRRVLWLSAAIVDAANRGRPNTSGVKVGGHQASSASMVDIMVALWFHSLRGEDRVSVKPHASPVLHAINYLLGDLEADYLTTLRAKGGLQSYPSRLKDPDTVDFSTGSVGVGATAALWAAVAHRYTRSHFADTPAAGRFVSLLGDAELDEGAIWEAVADPQVASLGELLWVVDLNRQSLDRVVPDSRSNASQACSPPRAGRSSQSSGAATSPSCSSVPAGRTCAAVSRRCPTRSTSGCSASPPTRSPTASSPGKTPQPCETSSARSAPPSSAGRCVTWAGTTCRCSSTRSTVLTTTGPPSCSPTPSRAAAWQPRATPTTTPRC